jgi:hypothetical protein
MPIDSANGGDDERDIVVSVPRSKRAVSKPFEAVDLASRSATELEMNRKIVFFLSELRRFQERAFAKNPDKAKKRVNAGLREVERAAKRNKLKCVLVAPNGKCLGMFRVA